MNNYISDYKDKTPLSGRGECIELKNLPVESFNVIVADQDMDTFHKLTKIKKDFNFINLSSDFAVRFVMEYEKIDVIVISKRISNLESIKERARKKKIDVFVIGEDLKSPLDDKELERLLTLALRNKVARRKHRKAFWWKNLRATNNSIQPAKKNFESDLSYDNSSGNNNGKTNKMTRNNEIKINNYLPDSDLPSQRSEVPDSFKTTDEKIEPENRCMTYDASINSTNIDTEVRKGREDETRVTGKGYQELNYQELKTGNVRTIKQKAIVFVKAKGGVGSTLLCIFLGLTFSKLKTLIVDLNFSEGGSDIGYYLNIPKSPSIVNFMESYTRGAMEASVFSIRNNLDVLQAPPTYELSRKIELPDIYSLVDLARRKYHIIVFDLSCQINELWLGVVDLADILVMVSDNTLGSLGRLISINKKFICQDLEKMLVINKYVSGKANMLEIEESQLKELLDLRDLVYLEEVDFLKGRSDFSNLDLLAIRSFDSFARKVLDILTYD